MSRAAGETAPILFTAAIALGANTHQHISIADTNAFLRQLRYRRRGQNSDALVPHQQYGMVTTLIITGHLLLNIDSYNNYVRRLEKKTPRDNRGCLITAFGCYGESMEILQMFRTG